MLHFIGVGASHVEIHGLIAFLVGAVLDKSRIAPFDLNAAPCFLLDVLNVGTPMTYYLRS